MARFAWVVVALALLLPLAACGSGGGGGGFFGTLEVCNDPGSFEGIDTVEVEDQETGDIFFYDVFLAPGECDFVDDFFPGFYDIRLHWSDGFESFWPDIFIDDDELVTIEDIH